MVLYQLPALLLAHQQASVLRLLQVNLQAEGIPVRSVGSATDCLAALEGQGADALVVDADLVQGDAPANASLLRYLLTNRPRCLVLSCDPADRQLARTLHNAMFVSRPDDLRQVIAAVRRLLGTSDAVR